MTAPVLSARGLSRTIDGVDIVRDVSLEVVAGEWLALVGPSGCGKTTLLQMLGLLDRPTSGRVLLGGDDATAWSRSRKAAARLERIGFVFQQNNLLEHLSARDNIALPAWRATGSRRRANEAADALLERFELTDRADLRAGRLSIGEAQRVAIARAVVNEPTLVLADEPTGSLDSATAEAVLDSFARVRDAGGALVVVTHSPKVAARAERTVSMRDGAVTETSAPAPRRS